MISDPLGPDYRTETMELRGGAVATLVALPVPEGSQPRGAMLYLHGFVDYFFQDHVARHFVNQGWAFYAIDLRRYGRSLRPGMDAWYTNDLTEYYEELDRAIARIRGDGHNRIVLMGHSTGGLISTIWANDRRDQHPIEALILNSPWLDLQEPWLARTLGTQFIRLMAKVRPKAIIPQKLNAIYAESIHRTAHGEWDFNPNWKPLTAQPVKYGFLAAVRKQHARLHKGMDVGVPVLQLRSAESRLKDTTWSKAIMGTDVVLDTNQMKQWLPAVGRDTTDIPLEGAVHDVLLSAKPVRDQAFSAIDQFLDRIEAQAADSTNE